MPFRFPCPRCDIVEPNRFDLASHLARDHGETVRVDTLDGKFTPQAVAQGNRRLTARISCPVCARDTSRTDTDATFRHCDDGTLACLDPNTLEPYKENAQ
jgi:hypothetical protein